MSKQYILTRQTLEHYVHIIQCKEGLTIREPNNKMNFTPKKICNPLLFAIQSKNKTKIVLFFMDSIFFPYMLPR